MEIDCGDLVLEAESLVLCRPGLFDDDPDKTGRVLIFGGDGRRILALVERAAMLAAEYPEECRELPRSQVRIRARGDERWQSLADIFLLLAGDKGATVVAYVPGLEAERLKEAMRRLRRYTTRLTRMDVP